MSAFPIVLLVAIFCYIFINPQKLQQVAEEIHETCSSEKLQQAVAEIEFPAVFSFVPWGHHIEIITKCKDVDEALFYIKRTIERGLSRSALDDCIRADLFHTSGAALTNFSEKLLNAHRKIAQEILKSNYDLLFYHIYLRCYVVIELKVTSFDPEYAGKLNFYVNAVNEFIRKDSDNPTIGLLICKDMDKTEVQLAFQGITTPMGVATYDNVKIKEIQEHLPTTEQIQQQIEIAEEEYKQRQQQDK